MEVKAGIPDGIDLKVNIKTEEFKSWLIMLNLKAELLEKLGKYIEASFDLTHQL